MDFRVKWGTSGGDSLFGGPSYSLWLHLKPPPPVVQLTLDNDTKNSFPLNLVFPVLRVVGMASSKLTISKGTGLSVISF